LDINGSLRLSGTYPSITFTETASGRTAYLASTDGYNMYLNQGGAGFLSLSGSSGVVVNNGLAVTGAITATGEITAYYSDARLKTNVAAITNAVNVVSSFTGVYYNANQLAADLLGEDITVRKIGLLAQEVEPLLPEVIRSAPFDSSSDGISKSGNNYKTIQYERIVPLLVEAIKELSSKLNSQQAELDQLRARWDSQ